jgi:hypothetical protein
LFALRFIVGHGGSYGKNKEVCTSIIQKGPLFQKGGSDTEPLFSKGDGETDSLIPKTDIRQED